MDKSYRELIKPGEPDFWKNFWFYNKKIIIAVILAVIVTVFGVSRCMNIPSPDAAVLIITGDSRVPEVTEVLRKDISSVVEDINGDNEITVNITEVSVPEGDSAELKASNEMKAVNQLVNGDATVVIGEKKILERFFEEEDFFEEIYGEKVVTNSRGKAVAIDITESPFAEEMCYFGSDVLCIAVKSVNENSPAYELYSQGKNIVEYITNK